MSLARSVGSSVARTVAKPVNEAGVSGSIPGFDYIGANALGAYDIAPLKTGVTRCFRVRRSSDNTEQDCLTVAEAVTFCGAGSGFITTLYDQNGSNNLTQATTTQQPRIVNSGVADSGLRFDGSNDTVATAAALSTGTQATICMWFRADSLFNRLCNARDGSNNGFDIHFNASRISFFNTTTGTVLGNTVLGTGVWYHLAIVIGASTVTFYLNGTADGSAAGGMVQSTAVFTLASLNASNHYSGSMRDVRVYNVAKSASEIAAIYASVTP